MAKKAPPTFSQVVKGRVNGSLGGSPDGGVTIGTIVHTKKEGHSTRIVDPNVSKK